MDYTGKIISKNPPQPTQASASGVWTLDEAAAAVRNNNWPIVGVPNPISKSLRFNSADSAYLNRTPASAGSQTTWTWSAWLKISALGTSNRGLFRCYNGTSDSTWMEIRLGVSGNTDVLAVGGYSTNWRITTQVFRDPSSWYHIVVVWDTTNATAGNRVRIYVNGAEITAFGTSNNPTLNATGGINQAASHIIGHGNTAYFDGYLTEVNFIDGQALTPSSFGQNNPNTGVWEPIRYTGTYGTNGFYLNFKDSLSIPALGYDYSGNANNWTPNNFSVTAGVGNDSLTDVPTSWTAYTVDNVDSGGVVRGNYATLNPLRVTAGVNLTNGNLAFANTANADKSSFSTIALTSGKWYVEVKYSAIPVGSIMVGVVYDDGELNAVTYPANRANGYAYDSSGVKYNNGSSASYGASWTTANTIGIALDIDAGTLVFYKDGVSQGTAYSSLPSGKTWFFVFGSYGNTSGGDVNFGQRPFSYTPPSGHKSLCTTNLPTPTIGATSTTQADDYFNTILYTGNNTTQTVTVGFQPDLSWVKRLDATASHNWADVIRGATNGLSSNTTGAAYTITGFNSFISTGFQLAADTTNQVNANGGRYASWNWKAGGTGVSNTTGSISSTVSANTDAGFSVVTYTGTGANATVGHGCKVNNVATAPSLIICKERNNAGYDWRCYHASLGATQYIDLNSTAAAATASTIWQDTAPTSTLFSIGTNGSVNLNTGSYVAYCFAPVASYSSFGSYVGNGSSDGPFIYLGFRAAWILVKRSSSSGEGWWIYDNKRSPYNIADVIVSPDSSGAEISGGTYPIDINSNGFKIRGLNALLNTNGATYIYAAVVESPFKYALAR